MEHSFQQELGVGVGGGGGGGENLWLAMFSSFRLVDFHIKFH